MKWSSFQTAIFDDYNRGIGNTCVSATPGAGKTTTAVEMLNHAPSNLSGETLITSFSKESVDDLKSRALPWYVEARTMNSLGLKAIFNDRGFYPKLNSDRVYRKLDEVLGKPPEDASKRAAYGGFRARIKALTDFAKNNLVSDTAGLLELADHYDIDTTPPDFMRDALADMFGAPWEESLAAATQRTLAKCKDDDDGTIDFNDQLWLPIVCNLPLDQFSRIVCDEMQDTNNCQIELLARSLAQGGRMVGFGENFQAVYAFRGAGIGLGPIIERFKMKSLPLSISYRCPISVVKEAQKINPSMQWAPDAIEGSVTTLVKDLLPGRVQIGDVVLSRTNAPLVRLFIRLLATGVPVGMAGKEVGARLLKFVESSKARDVPQLLEYTREWASKEIERRKKRNPNAKTDAIEDHVECVEALCSDTAHILVVEERIKKMLLVPPASRVTLSTTHKFKGKEADCIYMLRDTYPTSVAYWMQYASTKKGDASKWAVDMASKVIHEDTEERNLLYVATTRARKSLVYVE
jgi:superfamily I DNA/RNA helicase